MSGGSLDYFYSELDCHVGDFKDKELDDLVKDLAELFHDREWYLSGDTGAGDWNEARDNFKKKWFSDHGRQERIEQYLSEIADEVRQMFGISDKYCMNCAHWKNSDQHGGVYGDCEENPRLLWHRRECCEKFERD